MLVQNDERVGHDAWGLYAGVFSLCFLSSALVDLGLNQQITKQLANSDQSETGTIRQAIGIKLITSMLFPFLMLGMGWVLSYSPLQMQLIIGVSIIHALIQFIGFLRGVIQGRQHFELEAFTSNLDKTLLILVTIALIYTQLSIHIYVYGRIIVLALTIIVFMWLIKKRGISSLIPALDLKKAKLLIKRSLPFAFIALVYGINEQVDQVMVERLSSNPYGFNSSAIYAAAYRLVNAVMMYLWIVLPILFAKFAHHSQNQEQNGELLRIGSVIVFIPIAFVALFAIFHGDLLFGIYSNSTPQELKGMADLFTILCFTLLLQGFFAILSTFLTSTGHEKYVTKLVLISVVFNLVANSIFIPQFGAFAAAWSTFGSAWIVVIGYVGIIWKRQLIVLPYITWLKLMVISAVSFGGYYLIGDHSKLGSIFSGITSFLLVFGLLKPIKWADLRTIQ